MLSAAFGSVGFSWIASPAMTELESVCMDWYADLLNLPPCYRSGAYAKRKAEEEGGKRNGGDAVGGAESSMTQEHSTTLESSSALKKTTTAADSATEADSAAPVSSGDASAPSPASLGGGVIQGSASEACLVVLLAARARAAARLGVSTYALTPRLIAYATEQAHSCVKKACLVAGVEHFALIPTRAEHGYRMQAADLQARIDRDVAAGLVPFFCVTLIGSTALGACDPVDEIAAVCQNGYADALKREKTRREGEEEARSARGAAEGAHDASPAPVAATGGPAPLPLVPASGGARSDGEPGHAIWLHVDAAYAGSFAALPEAQAVFRGVGLADSIDINAHKGGLVTFDCSALFFKDETHIRGALALDDAHQYSGLRHEAERLDLKDLQIPLGRRFRALKLWFVLRLYGAEGYRAFLRHHVRLGRKLADLIQADPTLELFAPPCFGLVTVVARDLAPAQAARALENLNASGRAFVTHATLKDGTIVVRFAIGGVHTQWRHVEETFLAWKEELRKVKDQEAEGEQA